MPKQSPRKAPSAITQPGLRIREHLRQRLETAARKNAVTLNAEIVKRLESSFNIEAMRTLEIVAAEMKRIVERRA